MGPGSLGPSIFKTSSSDVRWSGCKTEVVAEVSGDGVQVSAHGVALVSPSGNKQVKGIAPPDRATVGRAGLHDIGGGLFPDFEIAARSNQILVDFPECLIVSYLSRLI